MKILYYGPFHKERYHGGIRYISENIRENKDLFTTRGILIDFVSSSQVERKDNGRGKLNIENLVNFYLVIRNIKDRLLKNNYDVIHFNTSTRWALLKDLLVIALIRKRFKKIIILHIHFSEYKKIFFKNILLNYFILNRIKNDVDHLILLSEKLKVELNENNRFHENKISVLYNFHDMKDLQYLNNKCKRQENSDDSNIINLLFLGSIDKRKGIIDLLNALTRIEHKDVILNIAGDFLEEMMRKEIFDFIKNNHLSEKVNFCGYVRSEQKKELLLKSDIMILPSYGEGLPVSILEGMACGCAIISTNVGAIPEILKHGENGFLIKPGDINNLSVYIDILCNDEKKLKVIKDNNIKEAQKYKFENFADNLVQIYKNSQIKI